MKTIYFDMDGTIAHLYGVDGWLADLENSNVRPYRIAKPMLNFKHLARQLNAVQRKGYRIGIISWTSKKGTTEYNISVAETKRKWLAHHMPSVHWDEIHIINYGITKSTIGGRDNILFDDEERNRADWGENAYTPDMITQILHKLNRR